MRSQPNEARRQRRRAQSASPRLRWMAAVAVLAALALVVLVAGNGGEEDAHGTHPIVAKGNREAASPVESDAPATSLPTPAGEDPELGAALNEEGFELIQAGRYEEAVGVLEESIRAFPPGTEDTNYAYALFNLGNALRLSGRAAEAIPVLERRLEIPNQTEVVRRELDTARLEAE